MLANFVQESANNPGTNTTVTLAGAATGRRTFANAFANGAAVYYFLDNGSQAEWGSGTITHGSPATLSRGTVLGNTLGTLARLNFSGPLRVYCALPAERSVFRDASGNVPLTGDVTLSKASPSILLNRPNASSIAALFGRVNNTDRWRVDLGNSVAETGSNAGSDFVITRFTDAGVSISSPLSISRATGAVALSGALSVGGALSAGGAISTSAGDITASAGSLRSQLAGAPTTGQVVLGNGSSRLLYNGSQFDLNAPLAVALLRGGGGNAGTLQAHGTTNSVNFRWDSSSLLYRIDEVLERRIATVGYGEVGSYVWASIGIGPDVAPGSSFSGSRIGLGGTWISVNNYILQPNDVPSSGLFVRIA